MERYTWVKVTQVSMPLTFKSTFTTERATRHRALLCSSQSQLGRRSVQEPNFCPVVMTVPKYWPWKVPSVCSRLRDTNETSPACFWFQVIHFNSVLPWASLFSKAAITAALLYVKPQVLLFLLKELYRQQFQAAWEVLNALKIYQIITGYPLLQDVQIGGSPMSFAGWRVSNLL